MFKLLKALPTTLQIVCWINIVPILLIAIGMLLTLIYGSSEGIATNILSMTLQALVVWGVVLKIGWLRVLILVLSWFAAIIYGFAIIVSIMTLSFPNLVGLIPIAIYIVNIWGFTTKEAKKYYGIYKKKAGAKEVIVEGMEVSEVEGILAGNYNLESKDLIFRADDGEIYMHTYSDKRDSSRLFQFESKNGKITKIY
jgi:hypothetical protein